MAEVPTSEPSTLAEALTAAAAEGSGRFEEGSSAILSNGSLVYEVEIVEAPSDPAPRKGKKPAAESSAMYLVRYSRYAKRPEEWVAESFFYPWTEALMRLATNRPPRKQMWVEVKTAATAGRPARDEDPEVDPDAEMAAAGRRSGRPGKQALVAAKAEDP